MAAFKHVAALLAVVVVFSSTEAAAQDLDQARRHYLQAEFEESVESFEAVLQSPSLDIEEAVEAHRYLVALQQMLGNQDVARGHARAALVLDLAVTAPEGAPPEVEALFEEARTALGGEQVRLRIEAVEAIAAGTVATLRARVDPSPRGLFSSIELRCASGAAASDERGAAPQVDVSVRVSGDSVICRAAARTEGGAALLRMRAEIGLGQTTPGGQTERERQVADSIGQPPEEEEGGNTALVVLGIVGGVAVVAAAVIVVVLLLSNQSENATIGAPTVADW